MHHHRHEIEKLGNDLAQHNLRRGTKLDANRFAKSKQARNSFAALHNEMVWLLPKFEKFKADKWHWSAGLLVFRLYQTSFMALIRTQVAQATIMCCVTLLAIALQSAFSPMRLASDNQIALLAQVLIFSWVFVLLVQLAGIFPTREKGTSTAAVIVGTLLCIASAAVFVAALVLANMDRLEEQSHAARRSSDVVTLETVAAAKPRAPESSDDESSCGAQPPESTRTPVQVVEIELAQGSAAPPQSDNELREDDATVVPTHSDSASSMWTSLFTGHGGHLCGAEEQTEDHV